MPSLRSARPSFLLGGDKTGDDRWLEKFIPLADQLYDKHLDELRKEGKL
jgi:hypothetical protein